MKKIFSLIVLITLFFGSIQAQNWNEIIKAVASDRGTSDNFGYSVAISGNYAIVGARFEEEDTAGLNTIFSAGSAYVFERNAGGVWNEVQKLVASDRGVTDVFGWSVAISGNYAIVGAREEDEDAAGLNVIGNAGSAYVFERNVGGTWNEIQKIVASDRGTLDFFGHSVAIAGDYVVVGAFLEDEDATGLNVISNAGSAYVFERDGVGFWNEVQKLVASDRGVDDDFGWSVAIAGDHIIVGTYEEDEDAAGLNTLAAAGSAYIFERNVGGGWNEVQKLVASDREEGDFFGYSVAISGNYAIVGARREERDLHPLLGAGAAYVFERNVGGVWTEVQKLVASDRGESDVFGTSVTISGDYILVGAPFDDEDTAGLNALTGAGSAYVFERNVAGIWNETQKLVASDREAYDQFGWSVAISGNYTIVGARFEDEDVVGLNTMASAGSAYFVERCLPTVASFSVTECVSYSVPSGDETYTVVGTYSVVDTIPNNCGGDSVMTIILTILPPKIGSVNSAICNEENVIINGTTYNAANPTGTEVFTNIGPNNCDSTLTVNLTVLPALIGSVTTTLCNESTTDIIINGTTYNAANPTGTEVFTNVGANNCDSTVTINLNVLPALTGSVNNTICNDDSIVVNGTTYNLSNPTGTEVFTNIGSNNCDSTVLINLNVLPVLTGSVTNTICAEENIVVNGTTYNAANPTGVEVFANCDSTVTVNLNVLPALAGSVTTTICNEESIVINGTTYSAVNPTGTEVFTNVGANNCDSTVTINLNILPALIGSVTTTICNEDSVVVNGTTYNVVNPNGTEVFTNVGVNNCDSTVTINLNVLPVKTGSVTTTICNDDSIVVNGTTYNLGNPSGIEVFTNIGSNNCDSTVTINLNVLPVKTGSVTTTICNDDSIVVNGTTYNLGNPSGTEVFTNIGSNNCDSTVVINLNVLPVLTGSVTNTICAEDSIIINGTNYNAANPIGVEVFANCDSTVTINLNVLPALTGSVTTTICNEESIVINGTTYSAVNPTGTEVFTNVGANNCDSTVAINLNVLPALTGSITTIICNEESIVVNGTTYNAGNPSGTEVFSNIGSNNCDSTVTINLNVLPALTGIVNTTLCNESITTIIVNGTTYNTVNPSGIEVFTNVGTNNCDSTVTINLNVLPALIGSVINTICNDDSVVVNGTTYNAGNPSGTEVFTNIGSNNCDSTVTVSLNVEAAIDTSTTTVGFVITSNQTGATYQWIDCTNGNVVIAGETNASYTATTNGDYAVEVTVNGCTDTSACVSISTVGLNENNRSKELRIYPNPTKGLITVSLSVLESDAEITVYSVLGQQVINELIVTNQTVIDLSNFDRGIYFIKVKNGSNIIIERIIKQ